MIRSSLALLALLAIAGCNHPESARAGVHLRLALSAIQEAPTKEGAQAIAKAVEPVAVALIERESVGEAPPVVNIKKEDWLLAVNPEVNEWVGREIRERILGDINATIAGLESAKKTEEVVTATGNTLAWLLGLTGAGGTALAVGAKALGYIRTLRSTAQVAFNGFHQAQTVLRQVAPQAAAVIDKASLDAQALLPAPVRQLGDTLVAKAMENAPVVPLQVPVPSPQS